MLGEGGLRPKNSEPKHLIWDLYFLKVYPMDAPGCSAVSGSKGAIDPKTMRKWVWLFLEHIAKLADDVVSDLISSYPCPLLSHLVASSIILHQTHIIFESRLINDIGNDCLMTIDGTNFPIQQKGAARKGNFFCSHKYAGKSALCYELGVDILAGNSVLI
jgi:hypothetical protein